MCVCVVADGGRVTHVLVCRELCVCVSRVRGSVTVQHLCGVCQVRTLILAHESGDGGKGPQALEGALVFHSKCVSSLTHLAATVALLTPRTPASASRSANDGVLDVYDCDCEGM